MNHCSSFLVVHALTRCTEWMDAPGESNPPKRSVAFLWPLETHRPFLFSSQFDCNNSLPPPLLVGMNDPEPWR